MNNKTNLWLSIYMIIILTIILVFTIGIFVNNNIKPINYAYYETGDDTFYVEWDDDDDTYDVFLVAENRHIFIPRSETEIVISNEENEICIIGKQYRSGKWKYKMYFIIYIDFSEGN